MPFVVGGMFISVESHEFLQKVTRLSLLLSCYLKFRTCFDELPNIWDWASLPNTSAILKQPKTCEMQSISQVT